MGARRIRGPKVVDNLTVFTAAGNYTLINEAIAVVNKTSGAATQVTLPASPLNGRSVVVKDGKGDAATNNITVVAASGNIDGAANHVISENYGGYEYTYNGTQWNVTNSFGALSATELGFLNGVTAGTGAASKALVLDANGDVTMPDLGSIGFGGVGKISWDSTDANANEMLVQLPAGGATDVPVIVVGQSIEGVDLGLYNGVVDPRIAMFGVGAVTTGPVLEMRKARGTVAAPTVVTSGDDLGTVSFYAAVAAGEYVQSATIRADASGTIATTRGPGNLSLNVATDAAPSVLTERLLLTGSGAITLTPATDTILANGTGLIVGATAQVTVSDGDGATDLIPEAQVLGTAAADGSLLVASFNTTNTRAVSPHIALVKGAAATQVATTAVADNEVIGSIIAYGSDSADFETPVAAIEFVVDDPGAPGAGAIGGSLEFYTTADGGETLTLAYTVDNAQNIVVADTNGVLVGSATAVTVSDGDGATNLVPEVQVLGTAAADGSLLVASFNTTNTRAVAPHLCLVKGAAATQVATTAVADNEVAGSVVAYASDGTDFESPVGAIEFVVDEGTPSAGVMGGSLEFYTTAAGGETLTLAFTVNSAQNLIIANGNGLVIGNTAQVAVGAVTSELQVQGTAPADSTMSLTAWSADAVPPRLYFGKSRSATIGTFSIITTGDNLGEIMAFGDDGVDFNSNGNASAGIVFDSAGTIAADRVPGVIRLQTATDAAPSVLTTAVTIDQAQLVTCAAGLTLTTGNLTFSAAGDVVVQANTDSALEVSDGTTKIVDVDTRNTVKDVHSVTVTGVPVTVASETAAHLNSSLNIAAKTITYTGTTGTTSSLGAMLNVGVATWTDASMMTLTTASAVHINAIAAAGGMLTISNSRMISTSVADAYLTNGGVWTDTACWAYAKEKIADATMPAIESVLAKLAPKTWQYDKTTHGDDLGRQRVGIVYDDLPDELRAPGQERGVSAGILSSFALAALKALWDRNQELEARLRKLEAA